MAKATKRKTEAEAAGDILVALAEFYTITNPEESVEASEFLARIQHLRRFIALSGVLPLPPEHVAIITAIINIGLRRRSIADRKR